MLAPVGWIILAFYPRYWLAAVLSVVLVALNVLIAEQFRGYAPDLANLLMDDAIVLTITFVVFAFGIVFFRKKIAQMRAKTNQQLASILERARKKS